MPVAVRLHQVSLSLPCLNETIGSLATYVAGLYAQLQESCDSNLIYSHGCGELRPTMLRPLRENNSSLACGWLKVHINDLVLTEDGVFRRWDLVRGLYIIEDLP